MWQWHGDRSGMNYLKNKINDIISTYFWIKFNYIETLEVQWDRSEVQYSRGTI